MAESMPERGVKHEPIDRKVFTLPADGMSADDLSVTTGACLDALGGPLGKINTRPGPEREVEIEIHIRERTRESE